MELNLPQSTVYDVLKKTLHFFPYKIQILHEVKQGDYHLCFQYASSQLDLVLTDPNALIYDACSDECTFFLSGKVNKQNCRIWGTEKPHHYRELVRVIAPKLLCGAAFFMITIMVHFFS
jgi:hypothetical protein